MPVKAYYNALVSSFLKDDSERILGVLTSEHHHALEEQQRWAWLQQLGILKPALGGTPHGRIFLEFYIPRMGKRADVVLVARGIVLVIEFKTGASKHASVAFDQVEDYALDLKNFHEGSHGVPIVPLLVTTNARSQPIQSPVYAKNGVAFPIGTNDTDLGVSIAHILDAQIFPTLDIDEWMAKGYKPTPTIVEAAATLYRTHSVTDISRSDAGAKNLHETSASVSSVIDRSRETRTKAICFVTGVPGSGKTLAGLHIATRRSKEHCDEHAVFLSGNGPLVEVLREALVRDTVARERVLKKAACREVRSFIQNIHHFRDHHVGNGDIPIEKVVVFDEAQRAWTRAQATRFMQRKRGQTGFDMSEPEFLISVMDRHIDWCTVVCLVGGGQEINTGEAGISEWISALEVRFQDWKVYVSPRIALPEYGSEFEVEKFLLSPRVRLDEHLHLSVSIRSFRAETLSKLIGHIIDNQPEAARTEHELIKSVYPIYLTRDLDTARTWLRSQARGTERFGLIASSGAQRLRAEGIHMKANIEPADWFLNDRTDVRSCYYLEDVASEFAVQGLELDWAGVCWDGDFHYGNDGWAFQAFRGATWQSVRDQSKQRYLRNAYRVILTRARQGMVIFVPKGDRSDHTRPTTYYDGTYDFLLSCGLIALG